MNRAPSSHTTPDNQPLPRTRRELAVQGGLLVPGTQLMMAHQPDTARCEKIRALRTELLLRDDYLHGANIVALLSPCAREGRSLLAAELAIAFAQTGHPTLLVDADLRNPHQHVLFGAGSLPGLAHALEHGTEPRLHGVVGLPRLSLILAGTVPDNPLELLSGTGFAAMIRSWRESFRFVVIDTAPVMQYSDGLAVASLAGRVLALSRAQHTPYKGMHEMLGRLAATRSHIVGAVISHF